MNNREANLDRYIQITLVAALTYWSFELIRPFLGLLAWGFILAAALFPTFCRLKRRLGGRAKLAAALLIMLGLLVMISILSILTNSMVTTLTGLIRDIRSGQLIVPQPPPSVATWPFIGEAVSNAWSLASTNLAEAVSNYSSHLVSAGSYLLTNVATRSFDFIVFILAVCLSGYILVHGESLLMIATRFIERVAPKSGEEVISIVKQTVKSVTLGVIGIAVFQALMFGFSLMIAGVPGAGLLTFLGLLLSIAQVGILVLIVPVAIWLFFTYSTSLAAVYLVLILISGFIDNILKPFVFSHGLSTPIIIILIGVLGGILWHGLVGVFIGPVVLAVFYNLFRKWISTQN